MKNPFLIPFPKFIHGLKCAVFGTNENLTMFGELVNMFFVTV